MKISRGCERNGWQRVHLRSLCRGVGADWRAQTGCEEDKPALLALGPARVDACFPHVKPLDAPDALFKWVRCRSNLMNI